MVPPGAPFAGTVKAETVRSGATSSLVMVTVAIDGEPTMYPVAARSVMVTVSLPSSRTSSIGTTDSVVSAAPAGMMTGVRAT